MDESISEIKQNFFVYDYQLTYLQYIQDVVQKLQLLNKFSQFNHRLVGVPSK